MIQVDDAGWGCLIGGMVVGVFSTTTGEFRHGVIAPPYFQDTNYVNKAYLDEAVWQVAEYFG